MTTMDRRRMLGLTAGGTLAAVTSATVGAQSAHAALNQATKTNYGAIVIGSGFGGSVAALRLGQAGIDTLILERGKQWPTSPTAQIFGNQDNADNRMFWFRTVADWPAVPPVPMFPAPGVMEVSNQPGINVAAGAAVGGGSIIYTGCSIPPEQQYFEALFPSAITYAEMMNVYYPRVQSMLGYSTMPSDIYNSAPFTHSRVFDQQMATFGKPMTPAPANWNWNVLRKELNGTYRKSAVAGESDFGSSDGAKNDLTQNYLPKAIATGHVELRALNEVTSIGRANGKYTVNVKQMDSSGNQTGTTQLTCDKLFLSAGSMNTSRLLVAARDTGALPNLNSAVGAGWGDNGDQYSGRAYIGPTGPSQGAPCASTTMVRSGYTVPMRVESWQLFGMHGLPVLLQFTLGVDMDNRGTWKYNSITKSVSLDWSSAKSQPSRDAGQKLNEDIVSKVGGSIPIGITWPFNLTAHPLGGAVLGKATDLYGRVNGYTGLYAIDGSLIPGSVGGANPSITIAALAERCMDSIIANNG